MEAFRRESCACVVDANGNRPNTCDACKRRATIAYDTAASDSVISDFTDVRVNCLASGRKKQHRDDLIAAGPRTLSQYISAQRIKVECVIGVVKQKFQLLNKSTRVPSWLLPQIDKLCFLACVLHNFSYPVLY